MKDKNGREYAKLSELKEGDEVELDDGFTCHEAGKVKIKKDKDGFLYFECVAGQHDLNGQLENGYLIGIYNLK